MSLKTPFTERNNSYYFSRANQQKAGAKIYSLPQYSLIVNECDWHILAGNDERINSHCLTWLFWRQPNFHFLLSSNVDFPNGYCGMKWMCSHWNGILRPKIAVTVTVWTRLKEKIFHAKLLRPIDWKLTFTWDNGFNLASSSGFPAEFLQYILLFSERAAWARPLWKVASQIFIYKIELQHLNLIMIWSHFNNLKIRGFFRTSRFSILDFVHCLHDMKLTLVFKIERNYTFTHKKVSV